MQRRRRPIWKLGSWVVPPVGVQGLLDREIYESIYNPGKLLLLGSWCDAEAAGAWTPRVPGRGKLRHRLVRIVRDYGMFDRREALQEIIRRCGGSVGYLGSLFY